MNRKVLSISIAAYNIEDYIENTVGSLLEDEVIDDLEIIIINDGSSDNTSCIAHNLQSRYPDSIIVIDKENGGYGSTINTALKIASGKYFKLLDGDDWYETSELQDFLEFLSRIDSDMVITPYYSVKTEKELIDTHNDLQNCEKILDDILLSNNNFAMHEITIKTQLLKDNNIQITEKSFYTDVEYVCDCFLVASSILKYDKPIYCYRMGVDGQSISITGMRKNYKDSVKVLKKVYTIFDNNYELLCTAKKNVIEYWLIIITRNTYLAYLVLENPKSYKNELLDLDRYIKENYYYIYNISNKSKFLRTIRITHFMPYYLWCNYGKKLLLT